MNEKELREKYPPRKVESQIEFDRIMSEMNAEQSHLNHPYLDRERELAKQHDMLQTQKQAINIQLNQLHVEKLSLIEKRKEINRVFNDLKHDLIMLNPREQYAVSKEA